MQKYFMFTKIFCQIKQNYTKNEHFIQQWSVLGLFARNVDFWFSFLFHVCDTVKFLTHLFLIIVTSMLKADLNHFQWLSSLFHLMFWILINSCKFVNIHLKVSTAARKCIQLCILSYPNAQIALPGGVKCHIDI